MELKKLQSEFELQICCDIAALLLVDPIHAMLAPFQWRFFLSYGVALAFFPPSFASLSFACVFRFWVITAFLELLFTHL